MTGKAVKIKRRTEAGRSTVMAAEFNYAALDPSIASAAKEAAGHIRNILKQTTAGIIEAGDRLKAIKDRLPHGQFTTWLVAEFGMSDRVGRLYMAAAEWAAGKTETVSVLQPTTLYALAAPSTPDTVKVGLLERLENGEGITDREVKQLIARAKEEKKEATEAKARVKAEAKLIGAAGAEGKPEANVWLVEPINTDHEPSVLEGQVETRSEVDPLAIAIRAVEMLSRNDRAEFDRWYRNTYQVASAGEVTDGDTRLCDNPDQLTLALEHAPEQDGLEAGEHNTVIGDD